MDWEREYLRKKEDPKSRRRRYLRAMKRKQGHVLSDETLRTILADPNVSMWHKKQIEKEVKRVIWFARAIMKLELDFGRMFSKGSLVKWIGKSHPEFAKETPAIFIWKNGMKGLRRVREFLRKSYEIEMCG